MSVLVYLLSGMRVGPHLFKWVPHTDEIHFLAEFGVVFLLFTIGLEFSIAKLATLKKEVIGLGGLQILLTESIAGLTGWLFGLPIMMAIIVGCVFAMSSMTIVTKLLKENWGRNMENCLLPSYWHRISSWLPFSFWLQCLQAVSKTQFCLNCPGPCLKPFW